LLQQLANQQYYGCGAVSENMKGAAAAAAAAGPAGQHIIEALQAHVLQAEIMSCTTKAAFDQAW
jgi:hypothetical protein